MSEDKAATGMFEKAAADGRAGKYILTLYVAGMGPNSLRAIENVRELCEEYLKDGCWLEIVDIYQQPELASDAQVVAVPALIKSFPPPVQKFIGDLSDLEPILARLAVKKRRRGPNNQVRVAGGRP